VKIGRILIGGVAVWIFEMVLGMVTCGWLFNWVYELEPQNVWKPMGEYGPPAWAMLGFLALSIILVFVYALLRKGVPGKNRIVKGIVFGLCVLAVGVLPGMLITYAFMTVATGVVIYWTIQAFIMCPIKGIIIAVIYGE
jgi:hypothetical protein